MASEGLFPSTHSLLASDALLAVVVAAYEITDVEQCRLLRHGWNDTYLIRAGTNRFVFRVYGANWHTLSEIHYELELLCRLHQQGVGVAVPLARHDGQYATELHAVEGIRCAALFTHASGRVPQPNPLGTPEQGHQFGRSLAEIHQAALTFTSPYVRPKRDFSHLVDQPLAEIEPYLTHRPQDWDFMVMVADELRTTLASLAQQGLEWGVVHGDPTSANAAITDDLQVTWYDFDLCGPGWPMSDVASAYASILLSDKESSEQARVWQAFLEGYRSRRSVTDHDLAALPFLEVASYFYFMALNLRKGPIYGFAYYGSDEFFDHWLGWLRAGVTRMHTGPLR